MTEIDVSRVQQAWRAATPVEVVRALGELNEYPEAVRAIIKQEAARRELRADMTELLEQTTAWQEAPAAQALLRTAAHLHRPIQRYPLRFAAGVGVVYWVVTLVQMRYFMPAGQPTPMPYLRPSLLLLAMFVICAPYRNYRTAAMVPVVAVTALMTLFTINVVGIPLVRGQTADLPPVSSLLVALLIPWSALCGVPMILLLITTHVRRRFWPVFTPGHCRVCDYNLHGLPDPRCPECGTVFEREEVED